MPEPCPHCEPRGQEGRGRQHGNYSGLRRVFISRRFFHTDLKAGDRLEKWQGRGEALQAECIREGLQFADCCRERLRNPPQSVLCGRRWGEGSGRGAGVQRVRDGRSPGMCGRPLRGARAPSGSLSRRLLSSPFPNTDGHLTATRSAALRFSTTAEGISILIRMID